MALPQKPNDGQIACGYYVTTTLKHAGFKLNRYKIAQQAAAVITKTLCTEDKWYKQAEYEALKSDLLRQPNNIYIVGLDYHVGFLIKSGEEIYFLHSSYIDPGKVVQETIDQSVVFASTERWLVGKFLDDERVEAWLRGSAHPIKN